MRGSAELARTYVVSMEERLVSRLDTGGTSGLLDAVVSTRVHLDGALTPLRALGMNVVGINLADDGLDLAKVSARAALRLAR